jgi:hypothetical protein
MSTATQTPSTIERVVNAFQLLFGSRPAPAPAQPTAPVEPHWEPSFEKPLGISLRSDNYRNPYQNPEYFATRETAEWLMRRFGARQILEAPAAGSGGGYLVVDATKFPADIPSNVEACQRGVQQHGDALILKERWLHFGGQFVFNAGQLGRFWRTYPDTMAAGAAEYWAKQAIAEARREGTQGVYEWLVSQGAIRT